jgi:Putative Flp pilus-assembly TadE/G-like
MEEEMGRKSSLLFAAESGQAITIAILCMSVLLGMVSMATDPGLFFHDRRHLQNTTDAAALAGAAELPLHPDLAADRAREWAAKNGIASSQIKKLEVRTTVVANDTMYVEIEKSFNWIFARVLGRFSDGVSAHAAARVGSLSGGYHMMPWALLQGESVCLNAAGDAILNASCSVKVGAASGITGWYGALDFDGNGGGASEYRANIIDGTTDWKYCIDGDPSPGCVSAVSVIDTLTGNKVGPTGSGIEARLSAVGCDGNGNGRDDFGEVFQTNPGGHPTYVTACPDSPRLVIIPIVSYTNVPVKKVTIEGWSLAYLSGYSCVEATDCSGGQGHWEVQIQIVDAAYSQSAGFLGAYDPDSGVTIRRPID